MDKQKLINDISRLLNQINNPKYLRCIYFFSLGVACGSPDKEARQDKDNYKN